MITQMCYAVPGARTGQIYTTTSDLVETDQHGRQIIAFTNPEGFGAAVIIMQKSDYKYVYSNVEIYPRFFDFSQTGWVG